MNQDNLIQTSTTSSTGNFTELSETSSNHLPLTPAQQQPQPPAIHPQVLLLLLNQNLNHSSSSASNQPAPKPLKVSLDYLNQLKEASKIIDDERAVLALIEINDQFRLKRDQINQIIESKLQLILKDLFYFIYQKLVFYVESNHFDIEKENTEPHFTLFHLIVDLTEILIINSKEFTTTFHMIGGSKCFLSYLSNRALISYLTKSHTPNDPFLTQRKMNYCKALASMLNCLFYLKNSRNQAFRDLNTIETITNFANTLTFSNCELILRAHFLLAGLARRKQIEHLPNIDFTILILEKTVQMFAQATQKKTKYTSFQFDLFYENEMRSFEINTHDNANAFIVHMLLVIEAFMVNDEIKYKMFNSVKNSLLILLFQGDLIEKYLTLNLLTNFAFDSVLNEKIRTNVNLMAMIEQILSQSSQLDEVIRSAAVCLKKLLTIKKLCREYRKKVVDNVKNNAQSENDKKKIVISYHDKNELICLRVKNELEDLGFNARLVQHKTDNLFDIERVLRMIEEADCVLICFSASYEFEKVCQFEAVFAHKLGKVLIPISVQSNYVPDYWVEEIFLSKRFYDVRLATIKKNINFLSREIVSILKMNPMPFMQNDYIMPSSRMCQIL